MYNFNYFKENDQNRVLEFMEKNPFALLTGSFLNGKQIATQIPFLIENKNGTLYLEGHIMRKTDHHQAFLENHNALVVFSGPHAYVSGSWYCNPFTASTWNYISVHASGTIEWMNDEELKDLMNRMSIWFENGNTASPTVYQQLPNEFLNNYLPAIVGIRIEVKNLDNVFKLSQNRDLESYQNIISKLEQQGYNEKVIAEEMKKRATEIFKK